MPAAGASSPGGVIDAVEVANVCSLCLAVRPFGVARIEILSGSELKDAKGQIGRRWMNAPA